MLLSSPVLHRAGPSSGFAELQPYNHLLVLTGGCRQCAFCPVFFLLSPPPNPPPAPPFPCFSVSPITGHHMLGCGVLHCHCDVDLRERLQNVSWVLYKSVARIFSAGSFYKKGYTSDSYARGEVYHALGLIST